MQEIEGGPWVQVFLGWCKGIGLKQRGPDDPHLVFVILTEDDGNWFVSDQPGQGDSSFWIKDLQEQLERAQHWMAQHAEPDGAFGYGQRSAP